MNAALASDPAVRFGFGRGWATSITTAGNDIVDTPITSEVASRREQPTPISILHYYAAAPGAQPANRGKTFFVEQPADQAGFITDAIASSAHVPHLVARSTGSAEFRHRTYPALLPSAVYADEQMDWDACIEEAPKRPSGSLVVNLEYAGRGTGVLRQPRQASREQQISGRVCPPQIAG